MVEDRASEKIATASHLDLELVDISSNGQKARGFRPRELSPGSGFSIALSYSLHIAEAFLVSDSFSGALLRHMGEVLSSEPERWPSQNASVSETGIRTSVFVNDELLKDLSDLPHDPWRKLEIECQIRIRKNSGPGLEEALRLVGEHCLSLALCGLTLEEIQEGAEESLPEGAKLVVEVNRYERNPINRMRCIRVYGARCWVCEMNFESVYGEIGAGFIVVHHVTPVSKMGAGYQVDPAKDLVPLCANCHSMVHRRNPPYSPSELRQILGRPPKEWSP